MKLLKIGSEGPDVELLQSTLKKIGYYKHIVDGIFEIQTFNSVINFQKSRTLSPDGIVGNKTWNALEPYINGFYTYTIKEGDTFFSLAEANNITVNSLISANPNVNYNNLQIGQKIIIPFNNIVYTDISYTSDILQRNITSLKKIYPFLTVANIGYSNLGTPIQCIRLGKGRKQVFYSSSIHANEWITTPILMKFLEDLCYKYVNNIPFENKNVTELFNSTLLYIVPMINPDGVDLVTGNLNKNSNAYINAQNIAKNFPELKFPSDWKANIAGVDLKNYQPFCKVL